MNVPVTKTPVVNKTPIKKEPLKKADLDKMRDRDREMVRGRFQFHEVPGGTLKFPFRAYKSDPVETYELKDGEVYHLPLGVARHLNKDCWYPVHAYQLDEHNRPTQKVGQKVQRCSFQSLEFVDIEDLTPAGASGLVTIEHV